MLIFFLISSLLIGFSFLIFCNRGTGLYDLGLIMLFSGLIPVMFFGKYLLWNVYGEEFLSISTKSISYSYNYGWIRIPSKIMTINQRLMFSFETIRENDNEEQGIVHFHTYDENNQRIYIYQTAAYITAREYKVMVDKIQMVFSLESTASIDIILN
jgi:hypothetical protein